MICKFLPWVKKERTGVNSFFPIGKRGEMLIFGTGSLRCTWNIRVEMSV